MDEIEKIKESGGFEGLGDKKKRNFPIGKLTKLIIGWMVILTGFFLIVVWHKKDNDRETMLDMKQHEEFLAGSRIKEAVIVKQDDSYYINCTLKSSETIIVNGNRLAIDEYYVVYRGSNLDNDVIV